MTASLPQIHLDSVSKQYADLTALAQISLSIFPGELVSVIGPSGCGKTTLLNLIAGFTPASSGRILVAGEPVLAPGADRTMIFQDHNLFPWKTVLQNIAFGLKATGMKKEPRHRLAQQYIDLVRLTGFEQYYPYQLSGGMRQRVAIARTLVLKPACILMDEPFAALDAQLRNQMQDELLAIWQQEQPTILFVTHDIEEAIYLADRVVIMLPKPGRIHHILTIPFTRPRRPGIKLTPAFQELKADLLISLGL